MTSHGDPKVDKEHEHDGERAANRSLVMKSLFGLR